MSDRQIKDIILHAAYSPSSINNLREYLRLLDSLEDLAGTLPHEIAIYDAAALFYCHLWITTDVKTCTLWSDSVSAKIYAQLFGVAVNPTSKEATVIRRLGAPKVYKDSYK